jgi:hypothetical protein
MNILNKNFIMGFLLFGFFFFKSNAQEKKINHSNIIPSIKIEHTTSPLYRDPVFDGAADPSIIWDSTKNQWYMFYTQRRANMTKLKSVEYCYGTAIGIATSKNYGVTWEYSGVLSLPQPDDGLNTFWAPQVVYEASSKKYHMFVTYIKGVYVDWGGEPDIFHYESYNMEDWTFINKIGTQGCIDAYVFQLDNGQWKMWYKDQKRGSLTYTATSDDMLNWTHSNKNEGGNNPHEGPIIFKWKKKFWMITDMWEGLDVYSSKDTKNWEYNNTILGEPGARPDDNINGRHADIVISNNNAYIVYFTHPGRVYFQNKEVYEESYRYRRSSIQIAELELVNDKMICDRNKYYP